MEEVQWQRFVELMGSPEWATSELFATYGSRATFWDALKPAMLDWLKDHTMDEIYRASQDKGVAIGAVYTAKDMFQDRQLAAREFFADIDHPENGKLKYPGVPYRFYDLPRETPAAAPQLGQHNEEIYCGRLGYSRQDLAKLKEAGVI
jgi:crotonobetainyl-CoA:carnitine CoA-transferase CaiB-like acyl-CoA transferase